MTFGYSSALRQHGIREPVVWFEREFGEYLEAKRGWSTSTGPIEAIARATKTEEEAWELFWQLVEEFRVYVLRSPPRRS